MNIFQKIGSWFKKEETSVVKLFNELAPYIQAAEPIVNEVSQFVAAEAKALNIPVLSAASAYLTTAIADEAKVKAFVVANTGAPVNAILHNVAVVALQHVTGAAAVDISKLDTAVQVAYSVVKSA